MAFSFSSSLSLSLRKVSTLQTLTGGFSQCFNHAFLFSCKKERFKMFRQRNVKLHTIASNIANYAWTDDHRIDYYNGHMNYRLKYIINHKVDKVNWPPIRDSKTNVSSLRFSSE